MKENRVRCASQLISRLIYVAGLLATLLSAEIIAFGQSGVTPKRGFEPGGSYALSSIESINTTNGNVMLSFPFKLPPSRGGFAGQLGLHYDSKDLDSYVVDYSAPPNYNPIYRAMLGPSDQGGWHYGLGYGLQVYDRLWERSGEQDCGDVYHWQVRVALPDGSVHEMVPRGWNGFQGGDGFYRIMPGYQAVCACNGTDPNDPNYCTSFHVISMPYSTGTITYYSFDGSYLKLDWQPDGNWTLYLGDGTRVTGCRCYNNTQQRIYDRNNNYVQIDNITYHDKPAVQVSDQLGRAIVLEYDYTNQRDLMHVSGAGGAPLTYEIKWAAINVNKTYQPEYAAGGGPAGDTATLDQLYVVSEIDLPVESGGLKYLFSYNAPYAPDTPTPENGWGELSSITLPSGAQAQYQYAFDGQSDLLTHDAMRNTISRKTLTYLQEYDGSSTPVSETTTYNISELDGSGTATITNPDGGVTTETHSLNRTVSIRQPDGTVLERIWRQNTPQGHPGMSSFNYYGANVYDPQRINNYVKTEFTSIKDANGNLTKTAIKDYNYDKNNNVTSVTEYDWVDYGSVPRDGNGNPTGIPGNGVVKRITTSAYWRATADASDSGSNYPDSYWNSSSPSLRSAVAATEVSNGTQTLARAEFIYDDPGSTGNLTQQTSWDSTKGGYSNPLNGGNSISVSHQYDTYGNPILSTDARGFQTQFVYGNINGFADLYPTQVKTAYQTAVQRTESREYDFFTGLVTRATDADNNVSTSTTYDVFGRPTLVRAAEGKPEEARTATEYSDILRRIIVRSDLNGIGDGKLVAVQHFDQLGRVRLTRQLEDSANQSATDETTGIKVQTRYLYSGSNSYVLTSNPYRANTSGGAGGETTMGWTRSKNDNSGRMVEVQTFGGSGLPAPWGGNGASTGTVTSSYNANEVTVTDQAGKSRRSVTDALGRLTQVYEDPAGLNYLTSYSYDAVDSLVTVNQGVQTRTFVYDSMKRLTSATNPESGTITYQYDNNSNLVSKTDARGIAMSYVYDALNRAVSRGYSDSTPAVTYAYDSASIANGKGRLASVSSSVSSYSYSGYDALGRALGGTQTIGSQSYPFGYTYDRAGHVLTQTYPSGRTVTNTYDTAGRANSVSGNLGDGAGRTYSSGITYASGGQMTQEQFGTATPVYNKLLYNSRGQLAEIRESTTPNDSSWNRGAIINNYGSSDNNGSLRQQDTYIPHDEQGTTYSSWPQVYQYDGLNRLTSAWEAGNPWPGIQQAYQYDQYGNRTIDQTNTVGNVPRIAFSVDPNTNRLGVPNGQPGAMTYDAAGNLTFDSYTGEGSRVYDAENRMTQAWANNQWQVYNYDGDGRRVKRNVNGTETWQSVRPRWRVTG